VTSSRWRANTDLMKERVDRKGR